MRILYSHLRKGDKTVVTVQIEGKKETYLLEYGCNYFAQLARSNISRDDIIFIDFMKLLRKKRPSLFTLQEVSAKRREIDIAKLKCLITEGCTVPSIAVILGASSVFIRKFVATELPELKQQLDTNGRKNQIRWTPRESEFPEHKDHLISLIEEGKSRNEIAAAEDVNPSTISKWVDKYIPEYKEAMTKNGKDKRSNKRQE